MNEDPRATALRGLASLLRSGMSPMVALRRWPRDVPSEVRREIRAVASRTATGFPMATALAPIELSWGDEGRALSSCFLATLDGGGDLAAMVDDLASSIHATGGRLRNARAAASGATLSGRMIFGLPVVLLLMAGSVRGGFDAAGAGAVGLGTVIGGLGIFWIARLTPRPPPDDDLSVAVELMSRSLSTGASVREALSLAGSRGPESIREPFARAAELMDLGFLPRRALERAGLPGLADRVGEALDLGVPLSQTLDSLARLRRAEIALEFETRLKRAPVLMALPLSLCLLPSFFLIGLAPLLRVL